MSVLKALTRSSFSLFNYSVDCFLVFSFICASLTSFLSRGWIANCYLPVLCWQKTHPRVGGEGSGGSRVPPEPQRAAAGCGPGRAGSTSETTAPSSARAESENKLQAALPPAPPPPLSLLAHVVSLLFSALQAGCVPDPRDRPESPRREKADRDPGAALCPRPAVRPRCETFPFLSAAPTCGLLTRGRRLRFLSPLLLRVPAAAALPRRSGCHVGLGGA